MISITMMGLAIGLVFGLVYQGVGEFVFGDNPSNNIFLYTDFIGPGLQCSFDGFSAIALGKLLSTHVLLPVYVREVKSGLYTPHSYILSTYLIHMISVCLYPMTLNLISFWLYDFTDDSFKNFFVWSLTMLMLCFTGCAVGITVGILNEDPSAAAIIMNAIIMFNVLGSGAIVNGQLSNWF